MGVVGTAIVVPGHGEIAEGRHQITERCRLLVAHAERLADELEPELLVFSGWSSTGGLSEAEQMRDAWRGSERELVVETTATCTAENASRTLPLLQERGIRSAVIVCAPLHVARTRVFFERIYGRAGIATRISVARVRPSLRALLWEVAALPLVPVQLRSARAELQRPKP